MITAVENPWLIARLWPRTPLDTRASVPLQCLFFSSAMLLLQSLSIWGSSRRELSTLQPWRRPASRYSIGVSYVCRRVARWFEPEYLFSTWRNKVIRRGTGHTGKRAQGKHGIGIFNGKVQRCQRFSSYRTRYSHITYSPGRVRKRNHFYSISSMN